MMKTLETAISTTHFKLCSNYGISNSSMPGHAERMHRSKAESNFQDQGTEAWKESNYSASDSP